MKNISYGKQTVGLSEASAAFRATLGASITQGPNVPKLEDKICEITGARNAVAVSSGTAALHLASLAADLDNLQETVVPGLTFAASASSVILAGGAPSLADIDASTWNLDFSRVRADVASIVSVDFAGLPSGVRERTTHLGAKIIEDCAHSLGARTPSGPVGGGTASLMRCFSLHPVKAITSGEGGIITTDDDDLALKLRELRSHGINRDKARFAWEYDIRTLGLNYRITDIQSAIALAQTKRLAGFVDARNEIAERYRALLTNLDLGLPPSAPPGYLHAYHLFPVLLRDEDQRNFVYQFLHSHGILVQVHYKPLHQLSVFSDLPRHSGDLQTAEKIGSRILSLPIYPRLHKFEQKRVIETLKGALRAFSRGKS